MKLIVMKALEKDRARRYETANGLALDIQRHLSNEPVLACPPSPLYRVQKLVRRNRLAFAAGFSVAAALVIGLCVATWMFFQERAALNRAAAAEREQTRLRHQAGEEVANSQQVARFLKDTLQAVGPAWAKGGDTVMLREVLGRTADRVSKNLTNQPAVQMELRSTIADVYKSIAEYYQETGDDVKAVMMRRDLLRLRRTMFGETNALVADSLAEIAWSLQQLKPLEAETMAREALAIRKTLFGNEHKDVAQSLGALAATLDRQGKFAEGEALHREAVAMRKKLYGDEDFWVGVALQGLAGGLALQGKLAEAETTYRQALEVIRKAKSAEHPNVVSALRGLGEVLSNEGKLQEAETADRDALAILKTLDGESTTDTDTADLLLALGSVNFKQRKLTEAEMMDRRALAIYRTHGDGDGVAKALSDLGLVLTKQGKAGEVETTASGALGHSLHGIGGPAETLATPLLRLDQNDQVKGLNNGSLASSAEAQAEDFQTLRVRADFLAQHTRWEEAAADFSKALELNPDSHLVWHSLAVVLVQEGQVEAYRKHCAKCLERFGNTTEPLAAERIAKDCVMLPASGADLDLVARMAQTALSATNYPTDRGFCRLLKGLVEYRLGHFTSAVDWEGRALSEDGERNFEAYMVQAMAYHQLKQPDKARAALAKGREIKVPKFEDGDLGIGWQDLIIGQALLREAMTLIEGGPQTRAETK
jgi:eukaryotic-like serine/threonine-protein kinase